jgi:phytoene/squalene synthetase
MNTLTSEKLLDFWRNRKQYFQAENNKWIIDRYNFISALFKEMLEARIEYSQDNKSVIVNGEKSH